MDIVALLEVLVKGLLDAENKFFENPKDFSSLERSVKSSTEAFSASFLGEVLSRMNSMLSVVEPEKNVLTFRGSISGH